MKKISLAEIPSLEKMAGKVKLFGYIRLSALRLLKERLNCKKMKDEKQKRLETIEIARRKFGHLVKNFELDYGINSYLNQAPTVKQKQLEKAVLLNHRLELLRRLPKNSVAAEVGVDKGNFSIKILEVTTPSKLLLIDIDLQRLKKENEAILRRNQSVEFIEGDSAEKLSNLSKHSCDWIYIDACHEYDHVRRDTIAAADKVRVGGYLIFNDYTSWSPTNMMNYGVSRAVNEFLNTNPNWVVSYFALSPRGYYDIALCQCEPAA